MLKISANDLKLYIENGDIITSGCVNTPMFSVKLSDEWSDFTVTAQFIGSGTTVHVSGIESETEYAIPWECIADSGRLTVSLMGVKGDTVKTAAPVTVTVTDSTITEGSQPEEPTPTAYEQYINTVNNIVEGAEQSSNKVQSMLDSESSSEYPSVKAVREYVNTLSAVAASGSYNDLADKPQKTSDFTNDGDGDAVTKYIGAEQAYYQAYECMLDQSFKSLTEDMGDFDVYGIPIPSAVVKYVKGKDELTEKSANKTDTISAESPSDTKYPSEKAVADYVLAKTQNPAWQLLAEYTAEEDLPYTSLFEYGVTAAGSAAVPLNVSGIRIYTSAPATGATNDSDMVFRYFDANGNRKIAIYATGFLSKSGVANGMIEIKNSDGLWDTRIIQPTVGTGALSNQQSICSGNYATVSSADFPEICGITISARNSTANIPAGTVFKIWGLK